MTGAAISVSPTAQGKLRALAAIEEYGVQNGWSRAIRNEFALVLEEWLQNVLSYAEAPAASEIEISVRPHHGEVWLEIRDSGRAFNPVEAQGPELSLPPEQRPIGGNGILMMKRLVDEMRWERAERGNVLRIRKSVLSPKLNESKP